MQKKRALHASALGMGDDVDRATANAVLWSSASRLRPSCARRLELRTPATYAFQPSRTAGRLADGRRAGPTPARRHAASLSAPKARPASPVNVVDEAYSPPARRRPSDDPSSSSSRSATSWPVPRRRAARFLDRHRVDFQGRSHLPPPRSCWRDLVSLFQTLAGLDTLA